MKITLRDLIGTALFGCIAGFICGVFYMLNVENCTPPQIEDKAFMGKGEVRIFKHNDFIVIANGNRYWI